MASITDDKLYEIIEKVLSNGTVNNADVGLTNEEMKDALNILAERGYIDIDRTQ